MKYLMYLHNGLVKKHPLRDSKIIIGRNSQCHLVIPEEFVSQQHAEIVVHSNTVFLKDLDSKNGIWIDQLKIESIELKENDHFRIGYIEFFLKEGNSGDFIIPENLRQVIQNSNIQSSESKEETRQGLGLFSDTLFHVFKTGLSVNNLQEFFQKTRPSLSTILKTGSIYLVDHAPKTPLKVLAELHITPPSISSKHFTTLITNLISPDLKTPQISGKWQAYHFSLSDSVDTTMLYVTKKQSVIVPYTIRFLKYLCQEIELLRNNVLNDPPNLPANSSSITPPTIITNSKNFTHLLDKAKKIASTPISVLITGETGTGKELLAKLIHCSSDRAAGPYVGINCSAIPETLLEDELFGHEKGAFTGAINFRPGKFELAKNGTLVLDEIGDMPPLLQAKLLRVLQEKEFYRLGGNKPIKTDIRLICITNINIKQMIDGNKFRNDLYYRISQITLEVAPLRKRKNDIQPLVDYFVHKFCHEANLRIKGISERAISLLRQYKWPGNIRQLENTIQTVINIADPHELITESAFEELGIAVTQKKTLKLGSLTHGEIEKILKKHNGNKSKAASEIGVSRTALYKRLKKNGLG